MGFVKKLREKMNRYDFLKNVVVLLSGSSVALLIPVLMTPILTRLFTPDDFGVWGTFYAIVGIFSVIANGRYELALLLPKGDREAFNLFSGSLLIAFFLSVALIIPVVFWGQQASEALEMPALAPWLWLVPIAVFTNGIIQAANYWHNRSKRFGVLSVGRVVQSFSTAAINLGIGEFSYFSGGMIVASVIGQIFLSFHYMLKIRIRRLMKLVSFDQIGKVLVKYKAFPVKSGAGIFLNILKEQAPIFFLGIYFDVAIVGFYSLVIRLFNVPLSLVAGSIGQVYYQKAVEMKNNGRSVFDLYKKTTLRMILAILIPVAAVMIWGDQIFGVVFGSDWTEAGKILVIFTVYYAVRFVVSSQSSLLLVFQRLNIEVLFNFTALLLQIASLVVGGLQHDYYLSLYLMSISGTFIYALLGVYLWVYLKHRK
ncbi:MAG: hypothetical protein CVU11_14645 [Bacteroidetes bacterium HGW-Bacteroidetes-6]|jgi:O-antigen/teichoic acid export membrane protein|nr:MAG: hypothetical protein CVU11_14645 [Bacteroidetes bacterium HGW-Bacteroidetes-6]